MERITQKNEKEKRTKNDPIKSSNANKKEQKFKKFQTSINILSCSQRTYQLIVTTIIHFRAKAAAFLNHTLQPPPLLAFQSYIFTNFYHDEFRPNDV